MIACAGCGGLVEALVACWPLVVEPVCSGCNWMLQRARELAGIPPWKYGIAPKPFQKEEQ